MAGLARPRSITLSFPGENVSVQAEFLEDQAPRTCAAIWEHLPAEGVAVHGIYSGSELYFLFDDFFELELENAISWVSPGDVGYFSLRGGRVYGWPNDFTEICWFYDRDAMPSMPDGPVRVNLFARMVGDTQPFFDVCRRMRTEGQKRFRVERR